MPLRPPPQCPALVRVPVSRDRSVARRELRLALRSVLSAWSHLPQGSLPLKETPRGPCWDGELAGHPLGVSFSYAAGEGWMGLVRGARIGIDAVDLDSVGDPGAMARHYFSPDVRNSIERAPVPTEAFAEAWCSLEAQLKCRDLGLVEWSPERDEALTGCLLEFRMLVARTAVAVAVSR